MCEIVKGAERDGSQCMSEEVSVLWGMVAKSRGGGTGGGGRLQDQKCL